MSTTTTPLTGSSWDTAASPDAPLDRHLAEWAQSAIHPALTAANLQSLVGAQVLELLAGDRLEQLGAHASQYVTGAAARLLRPLEPIAAAGGWWCSGLDPLADWAPMQWGCFKPDEPRFDHKRNRYRKYEHPVSAASRCWWLQVPAAVAQLVADRHGLTLPAHVLADAMGDAGAFWRWWAMTPALPLVVTEGGKKAAALLSIGVPAVALPGIWNGSPKDPDTGRPALLAELAAVPLDDRHVSVLFDHPDAGNKNPDEPKAARRLGYLLRKAGALVLVGIVPGSHGKGADDHLAAGGTWEQLAEALHKLAPAGALPVLRKPDLIADGRYLGQSVTIPPKCKVVALAAGMGAGKTALIAAYLAPLMAAGVRVVLIGHRKSLVAALADVLGVPFGDDALPGNDLRQTGIALCIDSLCAGSRMRFNPAEWSGAIVVIDEATAVLRHALMADGTAIARRRVPVLQALAELLSRAAQVLIADAQLDNDTLAAIESAAGERAFLIASSYQPAAGRQLTQYESRGDWYAALGPHLEAHRRTWISTTAAEATGPNSAQNLAVWVRSKWQEARTLVVDAETVADPEHDANRLASDPDGIASRYDVVIASPAIAAGLSLTLKGHFEAVFVAAGGTTDPGAVAQAAGRVRDDCPRHLYAPAQSPGNHLQVGCGSPFPDRVLLQLKRHEQIAVGQLTAAGWSPDTNIAGPWLQLWAQMAAQQNRARQAFAATVAGLLVREGYHLQQADDRGAKCPELLQKLAELETQDQRQRIITTELLSDQKATELQQQRKRLTPAERAQLQRWRINQAWALQGAAPSEGLILAHEDGAHHRVVFRWAITNPDAAPKVAAHDRQQAQQQAPDGRSWAPDLTRSAMGPRVTAARALELPAWMQRSDWFTEDDPALIRLVAATTAYTDGVTQVFGVSLATALALEPGKRGTTVLRQLLALAGARLVSRRLRTEGGRRYTYKVVVDALAWKPRKGDPPLTDRVTPEQVVTAWCDRLPAGSVPKNPLQIVREVLGHGPVRQQVAA